MLGILVYLHLSCDAGKCCNLCFFPVHPPCLIIISVSGPMRGGQVGVNREARARSSRKGLEGGLGGCTFCGEQIGRRRIEARNPDRRMAKSYGRRRGEVSTRFGLSVTSSGPVCLIIDGGQKDETATGAKGDAMVSERCEGNPSAGEWKSAKRSH